MNIISQINQIVEDEFHQQVIDNAEVVEKTPPMFFVKAISIIAVTVLITLGVRALKKKNQKK